MKYKLTIAYDGSAYSGWQVQPNGLSIQEVIQKALALILKESVTLIGSGRTDAGVHALAQVGHFESVQELDLFRLQHSLNGTLPRDIRIKAAEKVPDSFHAQRSAKGKIYHYHLWLEASDDPFLGPYHSHFRHKLSLPRLKEAAQCFVGTHDFIAFTNTGGSAKTTVRQIYRIDVVEQRGGLRLEFEGNGFLYKMVRNIVGTVLEVATGKRPLEEIPLIFETKKRTKAGVAAPAKGLFLVKVLY